MSPKNEIELNEVLYEFRRIGGMIRVCAIDPVTNTEITMIGTSGHSEHDLKRLARRKLAYVIEKKYRQ